MDEFDAVQNMKDRMEDLKDKLGKAMMASAFFSVALLDELYSEESPTDFVSEELAKINRRLGEDYTRLFELESQLY